MSKRRSRSTRHGDRTQHIFRNTQLELLDERHLLASDFGDAPLPYPTLQAESGAEHILGGGLTLGSTIDSELDGTHSAAADADGADEDGVVFDTIRAGQLDTVVTVNVQGSSGKLDAWVDFNADGSWGGLGEQILDSLDVNVGDNVLAFDVPSWATPGTTYARFRLSTAGDLGIGGLAADGEVEDYQVVIESPAVASGVFGAANTIDSIADGAFDVFATDLDGDGDMDVLGGLVQDDVIAWYENDGNENFTTNTIGAGVDGASSVVAVDVDGDGDLDVLSASYLDDTIRWYENDGSQNFTEHAVTTSADAARDVFAADVDADGDIDILSASQNDNKIAWYENDGSQNFAVRDITTGLMGARSVLAGDIDGDGDLDVVGAAAFGDRITWYENDGTNTFATGHNVTTSVDRPYSIFSADVDSDGDLDILSASVNDDTVAWYENDGAGNFTSHAISTMADGAVNVFAADVDGDGDVDAVSASFYDGKFAWYENDGAESFSENVINASTAGAFGAFAADIDGDGDLDTLSAAYADDDILWYENDVDNTAPTVLSVTASPSTVSDADAGAGAFQVVVVFDDVMEVTAPPVVTFSPDLTTGTPTLSNPSGTWSAGNTVYTVTYDVADQDIDIDAVTIGVAGTTDTSGNPQQGYTPVVEFDVDTLNPTVVVDVVETMLSDSNMTSLVTFTFSEATSDFTASDVSVAQGSLSGFTGSGANYTATLTAADSIEGTASVSVAAGSYTDVAGNSGSGGSDDVSVDTLNPTVTIDQAAGQADPTSGSPINFTVVFSEAVADFATGDVTLAGTAGATTATVTGSGTTYNVAVTGMTSAGTVVASLAAAVAHDAAGNENVASTSSDNVVTFESATNAPPVIVTLESDATLVDKALPGETVTITGLFTDLDAGDIHTAVVDWGDGSPIESIAVDQIANSFTGSHAFPTGGIFTIEVTVSDGSQSDSASTTAVVTGVGLNGGVLQIIGTDAPDKVRVRQAGTDIEVAVRFAGGHRQHFVFDAATMNEIFVMSCDGDDRVTVKDDVAVPATLLGGPGDDRLRGGSGENMLDGGAGADTLIGGAGNDTIVDPSGNTVVWSGSGDDTITTGDGHDWIWSGRGSDLVISGGGNDRIFAGGGNDIVSAGDGSDWIWGGGGDDLLIGGDGRDKIFGGRGNDLMIAGWTAGDDDAAALNAALDEWLDDDLAGALAELGPLTDDGDRDFMFGGRGMDELIFGSGDCGWS